MTERNFLTSVLLQQSYLESSIQQLAILLATHSPLKLSDLIKLTGDSPDLPTKLLENLKILICEHLVYARKVTEEEEYLYYFDHDECMARLYYPIYGNYAKKYMGELSWIIVSQFMIHKSLTKDKCIGAVKTDAPGKYTDEEINDEFEKIHKNGYLKYDSSGLRIEKSESSSLKPEKALKEKRGGKAKEKAQRKAKAQIKEVVEPEDDSGEHFYRLAYEKFLHQNRSLQFSMLIKEKFGSDATVLLEVMLSNSDKLGSVYDNPISSSFSLRKLLELTKESLAMTKTTLHEFLEKLTKDEFRCFGKTEADLEYYVNSRLIFTELINCYIGRLIKAKYGMGHARIYRILREKGQLEEKQLFDYCLLPRPVVRKIIETLYKDGIIQQIELLTKTRGVMRFFTVKENDVKNSFTRLAQKGIANMLLRIEVEEKTDDIISIKNMKLQKLKGCIAETAEQLMVLQDY